MQGVLEPTMSFISHHKQRDFSKVKSQTPADIYNLSLTHANVFLVHKLVLDLLSWTLCFFVRSTLDRNSVFSRASRTYLRSDLTKSYYTCWSVGWFVCFFDHKILSLLFWVFHVVLSTFRSWFTPETNQTCQTKAPLPVVCPTVKTVDVVKGRNLHENREWELHLKARHDTIVPRIPGFFHPDPCFYVHAGLSASKPRNTRSAKLRIVTSVQILAVEARTLKRRVPCEQQGTWVSWSWKKERRKSKKKVNQWGDLPWNWSKGHRRTVIVTDFSKSIVVVEKCRMFSCRRPFPQVPWSETISRQLTSCRRTTRDPKSILTAWIYMYNIGNILKRRTEGSFRSVSRKSQKVTKEGLVGSISGWTNWQICVPRESVTEGLIWLSVSGWLFPHGIRKHVIHVHASAAWSQGWKKTMHVLFVQRWRHSCFSTLFHARVTHTNESRLTYLLHWVHKICSPDSNHVTHSSLSPGHEAKIEYVEGRLCVG